MNKAVILSMSDKKTRLEASQFFHNIIKASVSPKGTGAATPQITHRKYEHKGREYWVTLDSTIDAKTKERIYVAYVSDNEPVGSLYGELVKHPNGEPISSVDWRDVLVDAQNVKQSEIDGGIQGFF